MSWIDIGIVIVFLASIVVAVMRGFVKEMVSLGSWVAAIWLAITYSGQVASFLPAAIDEISFNDLNTNWLEEGKLSSGIAFLFILVGTLIIGTLLNYVLGKIDWMGAVRGLDRALSFLLGFARGTAVVVLIILAVSLTSLPRSDDWDSSRLLPPFESVAHEVINMMPSEYSKYFLLGEAEPQASF